MAELAVAQLGSGEAIVFEYGADNVVTFIRVDNPNNRNGRTKIISRNGREVINGRPFVRIRLDADDQFNWQTDNWPEMELGTVKP